MRLKIVNPIVIDWNHEPEPETGAHLQTSTAKEEEGRMKPFYVVLLMGAAALGGGLVVRYSDHPVMITLNRTIPPNVIAPPVPPRAHEGPSSSVPVRSSLVSTPAPTPAPATPPAPRPIAPKAEKPSPLGERLQQPQTRPETRIVARVKIPLEPPAIIPLERSTVATVVTPSPASAPVKVAGDVTMPKSMPAPQPEGNHATLRSGMLITVRINEALSSNLNSQGDVFSGILEKPLIADGFVIAERGAHVRGEVVESKSAELALRLREILASDGQRVHVVSEPWRKTGSATAPTAMARGNVYDAAITRGGAAFIRPATAVTFRLDQAVELTEKR